MNSKRGVVGYEIDLELSGEERWLEVIKKERTAARKVCHEALQNLPAPANWSVVSHASKYLYQFAGGLYMDEMGAWAKALGVPMGNMVMLQCSYELSHLGSTGTLIGNLLRLPKLGCTIGMREIPGHGMTHFRSLDWPLESAADATRLFYFSEGDRTFVAVGICGFMGVLSGMLPGAYSVSMNWAPTPEGPGLDFGPAFLLRHVLETCDTYSAALQMLKTARLSSNVFFSLCGAKPGQACVIERTRKEAAVRTYRGKPLVHANDFVASKFRHINGEVADDDVEEVDFELYDSESNCGGRAETLCALLEEKRTRFTRTDFKRILRTYPVCNDCTVHQIVFFPAKGTVEVWPGNEG